MNRSGIAVTGILALGEWRLFRPSGISERDVRSALDDPSVPAYTDTNGRELVAAISRQLALVLGPLDVPPVWAGCS